MSDNITFEEYRKLPDEIIPDKYNDLSIGSKRCYGSMQTLPFKNLNFNYYEKIKINNSDELKQHYIQLRKEEDDRYTKYLEEQKEKARREKEKERDKICLKYGLPSDCTDKNIKEALRRLKCVEYGLPSDCTDENIKDEASKREKKQIEEEDNKRKQKYRFMEIMNHNHLQKKPQLPSDLSKLSSLQIAEMIIKDCKDFLDRFDNYYKDRPNVNNISPIYYSHKSHKFNLEVSLGFLIYGISESYEKDCGSKLTRQNETLKYSTFEEIIEKICISFLTMEDSEPMIFICKYLRRYHNEIYKLVIEILVKFILNPEYSETLREGTKYEKYCEPTSEVNKITISNIRIIYALKSVEEFSETSRPKKYIGDIINENWLEILLFNQTSDYSYNADQPNNNSPDLDKIQEENEAILNIKQDNNQSSKKKYLKYKQKYLNLKKLI